MLLLMDAVTNSALLPTWREDNGIIKDADGDALGLLYGMSGFESKNVFTKLAYDLTDQSALSLTYHYFEGQQETDYISINKNVNLGEKSYMNRVFLSHV